MEKDMKMFITHKEAEKLGCPSTAYIFDRLDVNTNDSEYIPKV
jgi:hypothetical protein